MMAAIKPMNTQTGQGMQRNLEETELDLGGAGDLSSNINLNQNIDLKALYEKKQNE